MLAFFACLKTLSYKIVCSIKEDCKTRLSANNLNLLFSQKECIS